ncbi:MAG: membrane protein [Methyloligella sp.]|nr:MAG: membrane protein [Methyloligella sp.]
MFLLRFFTFVLVMSFLINSSFRSVEAYAKDAHGSQDHPLISRYPDTSIVSYHTSNFEEFMIAKEPITKESFQERGNSTLPPVIKYEGKTISINYKGNNKKISALAVYRNYEKAFAKHNFKTIFKCKSDDECGGWFAKQLYWYGDPKRQGRHRYLDAPNLHGKRQTYYYWSGTTQVQGKNYVVSLLVAQDTAAYFPVKIILDVNSPEKLNEDQIGINLDQIKDDMKTSGKVVLDGIFFDFDKSTLKPSSNKTLSIIADYLKLNKSKKFFVVGHTDNKGSVKYNRMLSTKRAQTVVRHLVEKYGIQDARLHPFGVGPVSPILSNEDENGRAQNRRVELVLNK